MNHVKGPLLEIDAGDRKATTVDVTEERRSFVGGRGLCTKLAHDRIPFDADPLGPENRIYFASGPLQQSGMSFTGRMNCTGLSPLTDGLLSTNAGGYLSRNFVDTGHSAVEVVGAADELLVIHVTDEGVEFVEAPELRGATVPEVTGYVQRERDLDAENVLCIGPAGENQVRFACVMTYESRAFGRGGMGAVLGSKNVKAITFEGDAAPDLDLPENVQREVHSAAATSDDLMRRQGTTGGTEFINDNFSLPTRYFEKYSFEHADAIGGDAVEEKKYRKGSCSVCAFACKLPTRDEATGLETEGPEFETVFSFGSNCEIGDIVDVMKSNELCDVYGLDTISCGNVVAAYLASEDEFGNADLVHETVEKIAAREGVGDLLAEGISRAADELGVRNYTVKDMEFAAHDGRVLHGQGLSYAVANRGGDHMYSTTLRVEYAGEVDPETLEGKPELVMRRENHAAFRDSGIVCAFAGGTDHVTEETLEALFECDYEDLQAVGARTVELERHFNNKRGMDREADTLPYDLPGIEDALDEYYALRGWNADGTVSDDTVGEYAVADD
ncbi:aldehyde ferredoxin oxidoreductase family protein [Haloplanus aerogenes]|uniref:Aldehyde ferredoxin oxidoreductase n=1 Tax=Haloplanus aerogenes TaxID=660522 RepID=A0A3M0DD62_9EURY|nr:aldehyde ferredoxin oxidoreductase C-terminal domain-containing protein [Haloplanus aerogenes]AZH26252.1 aldehyde ferredoxin oxidoreductase [Haloplanus aerogenes]RMB18290.1 aldehyde:ferredoxin oxidoreductase [Haloplanus aerogenes]